MVALDPKRVVDEPMLGALVPIHPQPGYVAAPRPTANDAYAAAYEAAAKTPCPKLAAPATDDARYLAALVAARCGHVDEARRAFEALPGAAALASLGSARWNSGDGPGAIDAWTRAQQQDGKLGVPDYGLALAHFEDVAREKEVERHLLVASAIGSEDANLMLALLHARGGRMTLAWFYLSRVQQPTSALRVARATLLAREHRWADAKHELEDADREHAPQARLTSHSSRSTSTIPRRPPIACAA